MSNNLINLGLFDTVKKELEENGKSIYEIEEIEPEPSLETEGLGRLAACFLDSIATLGIREMALVSTIIWDFSDRHLSRICRRSIRIHGLRRKAG